MTAFAINSGGVEYYDQKTGGSVNATLDTYTISNESTLVIRTDTYACANHSAAFGSVDNIAFSGAGGEVIIDPTYVRYVSYTGGSGNSPAFGAAISQGGVSGVFLGVWADWQGEPIVPGAAIPASGFIKIGGVTGGAFSSGVLTGIAATCSGADLQGWIEVRSAETAAITVPRVGEFKSVLAWFDLGVTTGVRGQVLSCPTTATVAGIFPGVWVETSPGSDTYEEFIGVGTQVALATHPTDARAKWIWQTTAGVRIGSDGTNGVGYLPPAGCKVRIPAIILTCCTRTAGGSGPRVLPNATLATRPEFNTSTSGAIDISGAVIQWYANFSASYSLVLNSCAISDTLTISNIATPAVVNNCLVSPTQQQQNGALVVSACAEGFSSINCVFARTVAGSGSSAGAVNTSRNVLLSDSVFTLLTVRTSNQSNSLRLVSVIDATVENCTCIGARLDISSGSDIDINGFKHADGFGDTVTTNSEFAIDLSGGVTNVLIDNPSVLVANAHAYSGWLNVNASYDVTLRNLGSFASPFSGGTVNAMARVVAIGSSSSGIKIQRCYAVDMRSGFWSAVSNVRGVEVSNCAGDFAGTSPVLSAATTVRGLGENNTTTGQTAVYGSHWTSRFTSSTAGVFEVLCNEPIAETISQCLITVGVPKFNSSGSVLLTAVGQQIIWEMPFFALGHTALANTALSLTGTNTGNLSYEFQYDIGAGYNGAWLTANATNFTGVGAIDPAVGIKIKLRVTCVTANASNVLTNIRITTVTTSAAQSENLYPLDTITLTLTGLVSGSDVVVRAAGTSTILASVDSNAGTTWAYVYEMPVAIDVDVIKPGYVPLPLVRGYTPSSVDASLPVAQLIDRNYI